MSASGLVRINHLVRSTAFAWCLMTIGLYLWPRNVGSLAWVLLVAQFVVYPHLVYWRAARSAHPSRAERDNLLLDATLLGAWSAGLGFPMWITFMMISAATLNAVVNRGGIGAALSLACSSLGAVLGVALSGWRFTPDTPTLVTFMCFIGGLAYTCGVGYVVWLQTRGLAAAGDELRRSEERYRLIAENADDLVAMVDAEGRWLYTSPSHARLFDAADLQPGGELFKRIHPDDAEHLRRALKSEEPRELALRLVDREGRVRQYRSHVQPVGSQRVLVSHDVTDLRESEERMLLAGHALEGMTEAIMITAADGTIQTVNRAFVEITGHSREEVLGQQEKAIRSHLMPPEYYDDAYATLLKNGYWSGTTWSKRKNGSIYREWRSIRVVKDPVGKVSHFVHVFYEVGASGSAARQDLRA
ncbi:MAG TPA: PAS domain S-box protein [Burkholderiales bacterium]|nr:PAS domain S-box protein [Burkholderiales bacterium]